ncbi:hypothetical protein WMF27_11195 [Sorangium sp. So ce281]
MVHAPDQVEALGVAGIGEQLVGDGRDPRREPRHHARRERLTDQIAEL